MVVKTPRQHGIDILWKNANLVPVYYYCVLIFHFPFFIQLTGLLFGKNGSLINFQF